MEQYYNELEVIKSVKIKQYIHEINIYRFNWHQEIEIIWMMSGKADVCVEGDNYEMETDDILIIHSNRGHASMLRQMDSMAMVLHIDPAVFADVFADYKNWVFEGYSVKMTRNADSFATLRFCLANMREYLKLNTVSAEMSARGYFYQLLACLIEHFAFAKNKEDEDKKADKNQNNIYRIMKYTEKNYHRVIRLEEIAQLLNYNRTYVSTFFRLYTGINYHEYLSRVRLRKAVHQLNTTEKNITDIALDCGFPNVKSFAMYFKKYFQISPKVYRKLVRSKSGPVFNELERIYILAPNPIIEAKLAESKARDCREELFDNDEIKQVKAQELERLCLQMMAILDLTSFDDE